MKRFFCSVALALSTVVAAVPTMAHLGASASAETTCIGPGNDNVPPPAGFNPVTATDEQLLCYGFPRRPQNDPKALARWTNAMQHATHWEPGHALPNPNNVYYSGVGSWGGYGADKDANGFSVGFKEAIGEWIEPAKKNTDNHLVGYWVGIGGTSSSYPLLQAGTQDNDASTASHSFWYENVYGTPPNQCCASVPVSSPTLSSGNDAYVDVSYNTSNSTASFFMENVTTGAFHTYTLVTTHYSFQSAEVVMEDATAIKTNPPAYTSYNSWTVEESVGVDGSSNLHDFDTLSTLDTYDLGYSTNLYMCPSLISSPGAFVVSLANC